MKVSSTTRLITPDVPAALAGYQSRTGPATGISSDLEANIVRIDNERNDSLFLVALDTLFASAALKRDVLSELKARGTTIGDENLIMVASHTHFAPSLDPEKPKLGRLSQRYFNAVCDAISGGICDLINSQPSAVFAFLGESECNAAVYRRKRAWTISKRKPHFGFQTAMLADPNVPIDKRLRILVLKDESQQAKACIVTWPCHPTSSPSKNMVSADFIDPLRQSIRAELDKDLPVLFLPGASGDIRPFVTASMFSLKRIFHFPFVWEPIFGINTPQSFHSIAEKLRNASHRALSGMVPLSGDQDVWWGRDKVELQLIRESATGNVPIGAIQFGSFRFVWIGAEVCGKYGSWIEQSGLEKVTFVSGYADACFGYLPTEEQAALGGYEVDGFRGPFSFEGGPHLPGFEQRVLSSVRSLLEQSVQP